MYENNIALFLCQIQYLIYRNNFSYEQSFVNSINAFIMLNHKEYQEQFKLLYQENLIKELLDEGYMPLPEDYIYNLLEKYQKEENYIELLDSLDKETIKEITKLTYKFIEYLEETIKTYNANPYQYTKVLQ